MLTNKLLTATRRVRETPFTSRVEAAGVKGYSVYNHMLLPTVFDTPERDYEHLVSHVQVWDVSCQRQIELIGPDATKLVQLMTPRDLRKTKLLQGKYAPLCDENGTILNDPIIIKLESDRWWISLADSDIKLWAKGLAFGQGLNTQVFEADVWPLAVQGPKAETLMSRVFGAQVQAIRFFHGKMLRFMDNDMLVMRSGWSKQGGFEIYLDDVSLAEPLWDALFEHGKDLTVRAGCPNLIERLESGLLSYGGDMDDRHNPFEVGLDRYINLEADIDSISLPALRQLAGRHQRQLVAVMFDKTVEAPDFLLRDKGEVVGNLTAAAWSPRFSQHLTYAMVDREWLDQHTEIEMDGVRGKILPIPGSY